LTWKWQINLIIINIDILEIFIILWTLRKDRVLIYIFCLLCTIYLIILFKALKYYCFYSSYEYYLSYNIIEFNLIRNGWYFRLFLANAYKLINKLLIKLFINYKFNSVGKTVHSLGFIFIGLIYNFLTGLDQPWLFLSCIFLS
jgi:hypothetical protein